MKHILTIAIAAIMPALSACGAKAQNTDYTLTLPAPAGAANTMAYLVDWDSGAKIDSVTVTADTIRFAGSLKAPFIGRVMLGAQRGPVVMIEKGDISIDPQGRPSGTPLNDSYTASVNRLISMEQEYSTLNLNDSVQKAKADSIAQRAEAMPGNLFAENQQNILGLYWYLQMAYERPLEQIETEMKVFPVLASSARLKSVVDAARKRLSTGVGQHYLDFSVDYDGKTQKFSDYVKPGEYTLVDFWASWCGPCMRQAKVIKQLYDRYNGKGLNVVGVAVWDEPEATLGAIKSHGLAWPNIINAQTIPTDLYGINGIPCIILINPEGIIVSRDKQGQELIDDVDKAMSTWQPSADAPTGAPAAGTNLADTAAVIF